MRFIASILLVAISLLSAVTVSAENQSTKTSTSVLFAANNTFDSHELIVKFKPNVTSYEKLKLLQSLKIKELSRLDKGEISLISVSKASDLLPLAKELLGRSEVEFAEPNYEVGTAYVPQDAGYAKQWYLKKIEMSQAWDVTKGAGNITVAVIDSGVQTDHPELKGKIVAPFNMVTGSPEITGDLHGTHVAGIIAATLNKSGVAGIAPNVKIMPLNVFKGDAASVYDVVSGIYYAVDHHANIINMSLGSQAYSQALEKAINYAHSKSVLVVAAAGNENSYLRTYPAAFPGVIGVSATNSKDEITEFSNYGDYIDVSAPGEMIYSTVNGSSYQYMDGTSMAAPVVSGVAALMLSKNPFLSPTDLESILERSSVDLGYEGRDYYFGSGRINAYSALNKTPEPVSALKPSTGGFRIEGNNKSQFTIDIYRGTKVSAYVTNSKGNTVKKLITNKKWTGGKLAFFWDGKQESGQYAVSGAYKIAVKVTNGKEIMHKYAALTVKNAVNPVVKIDKSVSFSPEKTKKLVIPYTLNKNAKITAAIYNSRNKRIKKLVTSKAVSHGKRTLSWTGKDSKGKRVVDGKYKLLIYVIDSQNRKSNKKWVDIKVDSVKPKAEAIMTNSLFKMDGKSKVNIKLKVKESVYVTAYITTKKGTKIKKIVSQKRYSTGSHTLSWDGKNSKGQYTNEGKYMFRIEVSDKAGNKIVLKSQSFLVQDWRKP